MKRISESEWKVMEVVWKAPPVTAQDVVEALGEREGWKPQTIKTLISRLVKKGALSHRAEGIRFLYSPAVSREKAVASETDSFLERVCGTSFAPMLARLVESKRPLDAEEIAALKALLERDEGKKSEAGKTASKRGEK